MSTLFTVLAEYESLVKQLQETSSAPRPRVLTATSEQSTREKTLDALTKKDRELQTALDAALQERHAHQPVAVAGVKSDPVSSSVKAVQRQLLEAQRVMEQAIFQAKRKLEAVEQAERGAMPAERLIKYAHRISQANAVTAPSGWKPGDPRRPYPSDLEMRCGSLFQLASGESNSQPPVCPSGQSSDAAVSEQNGEDVRKGDLLDLAHSDNTTIASSTSGVSPTGQAESNLLWQPPSELGDLLSSESSSRSTTSPASPTARLQNGNEDAAAVLDLPNSISNLSEDSSSSSTSSSSSSES